MVVWRLSLAVVAVVLAGCTAAPPQTAPSGSPAPSASPSAAPTAMPTPKLPPGVARVVELQPFVYGIESAGDSVWVEGDFRLHQLDAATGEILQVLPGSSPTIADGLLWYQRDDDLVAADATTGAERATYHPPQLGKRAVHAEDLWVASEDTGMLTHTNVESGEVLGQLELPQGEPKWVEYWEDAVWVVIDGSDVILRVDPETDTLTSTIDAGRRPHSVALGFGSMWVTEHGSTELLRLAPDGTTEATIRGPGINVAVTAAGDYLWAASPGGLMQVDPRTNEVVDEVRLGSGDWYDVAATEDSLWLTTADRGYVYEIPVP